MTQIKSAYPKADF